MRKLIAIVAFALVSGFSFAQNIPVGVRMESIEVEQDDNNFSVFAYKDEDGTYGYYMGVGREMDLFKASRGGDASVFSFGFFDEICVYLGGNREEAIEALGSLLELYKQELGTSRDFPARLSTGGGEVLGDHVTVACTLQKPVIGSKGLYFVFRNDNRTAEVKLNKSTVKSMITGLKIDRRLHPKQL